MNACFTRISTRMNRPTDKFVLLRPTGVLSSRRLRLLQVKRQSAIQLARDESLMKVDSCLQDHSLQNEG